MKHSDNLPHTISIVRARIKVYKDDLLNSFKATKEYKEQEKKELRKSERAFEILVYGKVL